MTQYSLTSLRPPLIGSKLHSQGFQFLLQFGLLFIPILTFPITAWEIPSKSPYPKGIRKPL